MRMLTKLLLFGFLLGGAPAMAQDAQAPIQVPQLDPGDLGQPDFRFEASIPAAANLIPRGPGARSGHIWIGNTGHSIRIIGEVDGPAPVWPQDKGSILAKDHVEVWLAGPDDVDMPPIGYGNQFGMTTMDSEADCAPMRSPRSDEDDASAQQKCRDWFDTQKEDYRPLFTRLFIRQWLLGGKMTGEFFATPAYETLTQDYGLDMSRVKPDGAVQFRYEVRPGKTGYRFEIDIPYDAFPPLNATEISSLRFMVDVFSAAPQSRKEGAFSTTSATRAYGNPATFSKLRLEPPIAFQLSPCGNKLEGADAYGANHPAWFLPDFKPQDSYQADAFLVVNEAHGYQYEPGDTMSPTIRPIQFFWHQIGTTEWVCGPQLTYRSGMMIREYPEKVSKDGFDARRSPDGSLLIKEGPLVWISEFGSGQCGACPWTELRILAIDSNENLVTLLNLGSRIGGPPEPSSGDFSVSRDWSRIVEYDAKENDDGDEIWSSVTYCRGDVGYDVCDSKQEVKPPDPPVIRQLLENQ